MVGERRFIHIKLSRHGYLVLRLATCIGTGLKEKARYLHHRTRVGSLPHLQRKPMVDQMLR